MHISIPARALFVLILLSLSSCFLFNDEPLIIIPDACDTVHVDYPNVSDDSCRWVRDVIRFYQPLSQVPPATDTGGRLFAMRVVTDTGSFVFNAEYLPNNQLFLASGSVCFPAEPRVTDFQDGSFEFIGGYCERPPVDPKELSFEFSINDSLDFDQSERSLELKYTPRAGAATKRYIARNEQEFYVGITKHDNTAINSFIAGNFRGKLFNEDDATDSLTIDSGRFDVRYIHR